MSINSRFTISISRQNSSPFINQTPQSCSGIHPLLSSENWTLFFSYGEITSFMHEKLWQNKIQISALWPNMIPVFQLELYWKWIFQQLMFTKLKVTSSLFYSRTGVKETPSKGRKPGSMSSLAWADSNSHFPTGPSCTFFLNWAWTRKKT